MKRTIGKNMFTYNKEVDQWSHKMTEGIDEIWGAEIQKSDKKDEFITLDLLIKYLDEYLNKFGDIIIDRLNHLTNLTFNLKDLGFYVNTAPVSLHNGQQKYISIGLNHSFLFYPTIIIHELFHVYFTNYIYSENFLKANNISQTSDLISGQTENEVKEIITILINEVFPDLIDTTDIGYPNHKTIREEALMLWKRQDIKNFDLWITNVVSLYKKRTAD